MTKYTRFEAIFRNETLVFTDRDPKFRNRLDVYEVTDVCEIKD